MTPPLAASLIWLAPFFRLSRTAPKTAEEEGLALAARVRAAHPFHPALIDVMREQWAAIPDFQRTRGALRFLAACLRAAKREEKSRAVLGPGDVKIYDAEVKLAFFKEVGQQADFQAVLCMECNRKSCRPRRQGERHCACRICGRIRQGQAPEWRPRTTAGVRLNRLN